MSVRQFLRLEGAAVFLGATAAYVHLGGAWWLYAVLVLAPDLGMAGYLRDSRTGAWTYNTVHTYVWPLLLAAVGVASATPVAVLVALVWAAHIGADRALGFGLKRPTGFSDTHLDA